MRQFETIIMVIWLKDVTELKKMKCEQLNHNFQK